MLERWLERPGQPRLRYSLVEPKGAPVATVVITPGYSEHIGRFREVAERWATHGLLVAIYDLRGQGLSQGRRGHIDTFDDFELDMLAVVDTLESYRPWKIAGPPIAFGHSLGALISTQVALRAPSRFKALAMSSPYFGLALDPPRYKLALGRALSGLWPTYRDRTGIKATTLTHDPERQKVLDDDPLGLSTVTARWFTEVERVQSALPTRAATLKLPIYGLAAGDDRVASVPHTRNVFEAFGSRDKELHVIPGVYHELHHEIGREQYMAKFAEQFLKWSRGA